MENFNKQKIVKMTLQNYIEHISKLFYLRISDISSYQLSMAELGSTDYLIYLLEKGRKRFPILREQFETYKSGQKKEKLFGHDFDFFIKNSKGTYYRFALQAKRMIHTGKYDDLVKKGKKGEKEQWEKLKEHELKFKSKAFYLLYNGIPFFRGKTINLSHTFKSDCLGELTIELLGLGLLEREFVEAQMATKSSFSFQDVYSYMDSLRLIFCCIDTLKGLHEYSKEEIKGFKSSLKRFEEIRNQNDGKEENIEEENFYLENGFSNNIVIINSERQ